MMKLRTYALFVLLGLNALPYATAVVRPHDPLRHGHHVHEGEESLTRVVPSLQERASATTGEGKYVFRHRPLAIPDSMAKHLVHAHGGFAHDKRELGGDGATYFSLKGLGLLKLHPDLSSVEVTGGDEALSASNLHNTCLLREAGKAFLALPSDEAQKAFLTTLDGSLVRTFENPYGSSGEAFRVCDLEFSDGHLYAVNGYADNVCFVTNPLRGSAQGDELGVWEERRFGGTGTEHGLFGTAHGITRVPGTQVLTIADRANARIESFSPQGRYIGGIKLPEGAMPCDVDYHGDLVLVGCLKGPGGSTPAPIYLLERGNLVAELNIGRDLGLEGFTHIHNAAFHIATIDGVERLFVLAYAWNPGNFAILEQVIE